MNKKIFKREVQWCFKTVRLKVDSDYIRIKVQETATKEQFYAFWYDAADSFLR